MEKLGPSKNLLNTILNGTSKEERDYYENLYNHLDDVGKSDLLEQMWYGDGLKEYELSEESGKIFFTFPCNIGYVVQKGKSFGEDVLSIRGPVHIRGNNELQSARLHAIYGYLERKFGYDESAYYTLSEACETLICFKGKPVEHLSHHSLM